MALVPIIADTLGLPPGYDRAPRSRFSSVYAQYIAAKREVG